MVVLKEVGENVHPSYRSESSVLHTNWADLVGRGRARRRWPSSSKRPGAVLVKLLRMAQFVAKHCRKAAERPAAHVLEDPEAVEASALLVGLANVVACRSELG
jgi:hypothetical protein